MCIIHSMLGLHVKGDEVVLVVIVIVITIEVVIAHELVGQNRHNCSAPGQQLLQRAWDAEFRVLR